MAFPAHTVPVALTSVFGTALAGRESVSVFDGPPGADVYDDIVVGVGVTYNESIPPIESDPVIRGAGDNVDERVTVRCWLQVIKQAGTSVQECRAALAEVLGVLESAVNADPTLGGVAGLCWLPGVQRYWQGTTVEGTFCEVFFDAIAVVYR